MHVRNLDGILILLCKTKHLMAGKTQDDSLQADFIVGIKIGIKFWINFIPAVHNINAARLRMWMCTVGFRVLCSVFLWKGSGRLWVWTGQSKHAT